MRPTPAEIVRHHDQFGSDLDAVVPGYVAPTNEIRLEEYDAEWALLYASIAAQIKSALGERVIELHHVGSTSVPGLSAKPIIDIDLVVADSANEASYVPDLLQAGFVHAIREPWWHEHRLVVLNQPRSHVHIFSPDCPEVIRHMMFRDWLRDHPNEREVYEHAKRDAAATTNSLHGSGMDYNRNKQRAVRDIYDRMFRAHRLL
jgi:GrpB-like predicted nucleotidyltransferase (UPF0157 family)